MNATENNILNCALNLAEKGFYIFPIKPGEKTPAIEGWQDAATTDPERIKKWWDKNPQYNIGISTSKFNGEGEALLAVDVDNKGAKRGDDEVFRLELEGFEFTPTFTQLTPTGGKHFIYKVKEAVKQGTDKLGSGLDIRSKGGYLVGAGSILHGKAYSLVDSDIADAPHWIITRCGKPKEKSPPLPIEKVDRERANERAVHYLRHEAPLAIEGASGDQTTFIVAARLKDFGVSYDDALTLMDSFWNDRCSPPWSIEDLSNKIINAFNYGKNAQGESAPELDFDPIEVQEDKLAPVQELNKNFAFVIAGGGDHILWETKSAKGNYKLEHISAQTFQRLLKSKVVIGGDGKMKEISTLWMKSKNRRTYNGIVFMPGKEAPKGFYNLWRGFTVEPTSNVSQKAEFAFSLYLEHIKENICENNPQIFNWVMSYFAHLIQKPWEKPHVALVLRGEKGVGKNIFINQIGRLLGPHYLLTSNDRYLSGNFNSHLENLLLFTLDEAFWSGDKRAEGTLKDLITGETHLIERKGYEPYTVDNCLRLVILGNEDWLVPASQDERRFAVFHVAPTRKQDTKYFTQIKEGMDEGGNKLLLKYLQEYDISHFNPNVAPNTEALKEQKLSSLNAFYQWWHQSLIEGRIVGMDFNSEWPSEIERDVLRQGFKNYFIDRRIRGRVIDSVVFGKMLSKVFPESTISGRKRIDGVLTNTYKLPSLVTSRKNWEVFMGQPEKWDPTDS